MGRLRKAFHSPDLISSHLFPFMSSSLVRVRSHWTRKKYGQVRIRTEDLPHAKGARYQLRHMPVLELEIPLSLLELHSL